LRKRGLITTR